MLDTTGLSKYPRFKEIIANMPAFLGKYPNVLAALVYYTGLSEARITQLMQPGVGPSVVVVQPQLKDEYDNALLGHYDTQNKVLEISGSWVRGLEATQTPIYTQATGLLLLMTTLHEFVHYGRAADGLNSNTLPNGQEAGLRFEMSISRSGDDIIDKNNAIKWLKFYKYEDY